MNAPVHDNPTEGSDPQDVLERLLSTGDEETLSKLLADAPSDLLSEAVSRNMMSLTKLLLARPATDVNSPTSWYSTPLHLAVSGGNLEMVTLLATHPKTSGAVFNYARVTPFWVACFQGLLPITKVLLATGREGPQEELMGFQGVTPKDAALKKGHADVAGLVARFLENPEVVRRELAIEIGLSQLKSATTFCLIVLLSDGYLKVQDSSLEEGERSRKFFRLAQRLPMDLQMVLSNRLFAVRSDIVSLGLTKQGFQELAVSYKGSP